MCVVTEAPPTPLPKLYDMYDADTVEEVSRAISDALSEAVLLASSTGELIWHNPVALDLFRITSEELLGRRLDDDRWHAINLDGSPFDFAAAKAIAESGRQDVVDQPLGIRTGDSRLTWLSADLAPIEIDGEDCMIVVLSDVTAQIAERRMMHGAIDTLRAGLTPAELPHCDVVRFASGRREGSATAGVSADFYSAAGHGETARFVIGDSLGAGAEQIALSITTLTALRALKGIMSGPAAAIERLDDVIEVANPRHGVTVVCGRVERRHGITTASLVCAGHALPILIRDGRATEIGASSPMIGVTTSSGRTATTHELRSGDIVIAYTDGLTTSVEPRLSPDDLLERIPTNVSVDVVVDTLLRMYDTNPAHKDGVAILGFEVR